MALEPMNQPALLQDSNNDVTQIGDKRKKASATKAVSLPNLGKAVKLPTPDFSDPNRPLTCLEIDFPIVPINLLARQEGNAGKPIYQMSKWWARRRSSVFRAMLIAAATQAPVDPTDAAKRVWDGYYANHQAAGSFSKLSVLDPFMGGGTTLVEGARLGMQMSGIDLNPVAWLVVKNELAASDPEQVKSLFQHIEAEVKPQIQPFYVTSCPRGHQGQWIDSRTSSTSEVDPITLPPEERRYYRWQGPEIIYTFWAKHGPCPASGCGHRTPVFKSPLIAEKKLSASYIPLTCPTCGLNFHAELGETRMAPGATHIVLGSEGKFTETSQRFAQSINEYEKGTNQERYARITTLLKMAPDEPGLRCPDCGEFAGSTVLSVLQKHAQPTTKNSLIKKSAFGIARKPVYMSLFIHPRWLAGSPGNEAGVPMGGYVGATPEQSAAWYAHRAQHLTLIEVRGRGTHTERGIRSGMEAVETVLNENALENSQDGIDVSRTDDSAENEINGVGVGDGLDSQLDELPYELLLPDGSRLQTHVGTVPTNSVFTCQACGRNSDLLTAVKASGHSAPTSVYALQCYCPQCDAEGYNYGGRYFKAPDRADVQHIVAADEEWNTRSASDLEGYWPHEKLPYAWMTHHLNGGIPNWGYTHWWTMFNARQLLVHAQLLRAITEAPRNQWPLGVCEQALGAFQQYLRNQNMFCFWDMGYDKLVPHFSNANYHPKSLVVENCVYPSLGRGNWTSTTETVLEALSWCKTPWESFVPPHAQRGIKIHLLDRVEPSKTKIFCGSASELPITSETLDLVITDPPFGDNVFYADLADFFYVWLRIPLLRWYEGQPEAQYFSAPATPKALEAITNRAEHPDTRTDEEKGAEVRAPADEFYQHMLTSCWAEAYRVLKPGGSLAFTFHHSDDEPWVNVLESLFDAGFILVATYPIRSDESKGESGQFGSRKIEYDIIHVCRKRLASPPPISWARMRTWVKDEVVNLRRMLELYRQEQLPEADIRVILRGKALQFFSRHYGQVTTGSHQPLSIRDALIGINQLLDDTSEENGLRPPEMVDPITYLFLGIFHGRSSLQRDELHKLLRGNIVNPNEFIKRGWLKEANKIVSVAPIEERFRELRKPGRRRDSINVDLDQAHFLIGSALPNSGVDIQRELLLGSMVLRDGVEPLLGWYAETSPDTQIRDAAARAQRFVRAWREERKQSRGPQQGTLFDEVVDYTAGGDS